MPNVVQMLQNKFMVKKKSKVSVQEVFVGKYTKYFTKLYTDNFNQLLKIINCPFDLALQHSEYA